MAAKAKLANISLFSDVEAVISEEPRTIANDGVRTLSWAPLPPDDVRRDVGKIPRFGVEPR
jgi:hypothetical protein